MRAGLGKVQAKMSIWVVHTLVIIKYLETLRVPLQGSSTKCESKPKIRLKGVVNKQHVNISSTKCESKPKIRLKGVVNKQHVNIHVQSVDGPQGRKGQISRKYLSVQAHKVPLFFQGKKG
jgi:hypothetical protein